jgi:hypothetical protein
MKTQRQLQQQPIKQSPSPGQSAEKQIEPKTEEISRWEGEGGSVVPTGNLMSKLHARLQAKNIR